MLLIVLSHIHDLTKNPPHLETMMVVKEFMDVFPIDLPVFLLSDIFLVTWSWVLNPFPSLSIECLQ